MSTRISGQGFSPEEAVPRMTVAPGFAVELVASEPEVRQPVAIDFDDQGRLWVLQYLQYPNPAGLKRVKVDRYSRTTYDRIPEPPPHGPRGADRLTILEDSDGDGRCDRSRDFVDGLNLATGFAFGHGGVFVLQAPYLLFYPDRDRDDVPDGAPEVLLKGFGMEDSSSLANSLVWGPDGWLYGTQGTNIVASIRGIEFEQGVWRYDPRSKKFELFGEGGGNMWGLDFDRRGNLFAGTNYGGFLGLHFVRGAYYVKSFAKHGELHNPFAFGYFEHTPHRNFQGGHVTVGGFFYEGDAFPETFRGKYIAVDTLGHAVRWHHLIPDGSTFRSENGGVLLEANDNWFAPSDATLGPDGAVYVADWYDQRTAHPDPDAEWDRSNGRIYRIVYRGTQRNATKEPASSKTASPLSDLNKSIDPNSLSSDELIKWLDDSNGWKVRRARRIFAERNDPRVAELLRKRLEAVGESQTKLEYLWALQGMGRLTSANVLLWLNHGEADRRVWAVRTIGDLGSTDEQTVASLIQLAQSDPSSRVICALACTCQQLNPEASVRIARAIAARSEFREDRYIPLLVWWAVERNSIAAAARVIDEFASPEAWTLPLAGEVILPRLMRRYAAEGTDAGFELCAKILSTTPTNARRRMLTELDAGLSLLGKTRTPGLPPGTSFTNLAAPSPTSLPKATRLKSIPDALAAVLAETWNDETTDPLLIRLAMRLGSDVAQDRALSLARNPNVAVETRIAMLEILALCGDVSSIDDVLRLIDNSEPDAVQLAALRVLGHFADERIPTRLLSAYGELRVPVRAGVRDILLARRESTRSMLKEVDEQRIAKAEVTIDDLRRASLHNDTSMDALIKKHWGAIRPGTPEEKLAEIRRISNDLRAAPGNATRGKLLFAKHCANCHKLFGEGNEIGPDLTRANRSDRDFLLVSVVDPSAQIRKEYLTHVVTTSDGRVVTGILVEETPSSLALVGPKNERTRIERAEIEEMRISDASLMPENILQSLHSDELRDLFHYLQSGS